MTCLHCGVRPRLLGLFCRRCWRAAIARADEAALRHWSENEPYQGVDIGAYAVAAIRAINELEPACR